MHNSYCSRICSRIPSRCRSFCLRSEGALTLVFNRIKQKWVPKSTCITQPAPMSCPLALHLTVCGGIRTACGQSALSMANTCAFQLTMASLSPASHPANCGGIPFVCSQTTISVACTRSLFGCVLPTFVSHCILQQPAQATQAHPNTCKILTSVGSNPKWRLKLIMSYFSPPFILAGPRVQTPDATPRGGVPHQSPTTTDGSPAFLPKVCGVTLTRNGV